jgi:hypothetical protein
MAMTTPLAYMVFFLPGAGLTLASLFTGRIKAPVIKWRNRLLVLVWFFFPPAYLIATRAVLYDGWRHIFFVYPALLVLGLAGLVWLFRTLRCGVAGRWSALAVPAVALAVALNLGSAVLFMIRSHPYQNLYFNALVGGVKGAEGKFDLDYWGLAYRGALEHILRVDSREEIRIYVSHDIGRDSAKLLRPVQRKRLVFVSQSSRANYHLSNLRWKDRKQVTAEPWHTIDVDDVAITAIYRVRL